MLWSLLGFKGALQVFYINICNQDAIGKRYKHILKQGQHTLPSTVSATLLRSGIYSALIQTADLVSKLLDINCNSEMS